MPFVEANGLKHHYQLSGDTSGRPLLLVHGLTGNMTNWYLVAGTSQLSDFNVINYDIRGHGKSEFSADGYDLKTLAKDLSQLAENLTGGTKVVVAGYSYGAPIAIQLALMFPHQVDKVIVVEPTLPPLDRLREFSDALTDDKLDLLPEHIKQSLREHPIQFIKVIKKQKAFSKNTSLFEDAESEPAFSDASLGKLVVPTLLISAESTEFTDDRDRMIAAVPGLRVEIVNGDHALVVKQPETVAESIRTFING